MSSGIIPTPTRSATLPPPPFLSGVMVHDTCSAKSDAWVDLEWETLHSRRPDGLGWNSKDAAKKRYARDPVKLLEDEVVVQDLKVKMRRQTPTEGLRGGTASTAGSGSPR